MFALTMCFQLADPLTSNDFAKGLGFCTAFFFSVPIIQHLSWSGSPQCAAATSVSLFITVHAAVLRLPTAWLAPPAQRITEQVRLKMQAMPLTVEAILLTAWD